MYSGRWIKGLMRCHLPAQTGIYKISKKFKFSYSQVIQKNVKKNVKLNPTGTLANFWERKKTPFALPALFHPTTQILLFPTKHSQSEAHERKWQTHKTTRSRKPLFWLYTHPGTSGTSANQSSSTCTVHAPVHQRVSRQSSKRMKQWLSIEHSARYFTVYHILHLPRCEGVVKIFKRQLFCG